MKLWPVHKQGVLGFGKAVEKMIQCLNNTLYTSAVVLRLKEQKVMIKKLGLALLTSAIASMSMASVESVQANLKKNYPNINVQNIQKTEMSGIYSGSLDGEIVYLGEAAEHVIAGSMVRLKDQKNLSAALYVQQNSLDWNKLPLKDAIKSVKGNGKRQLAVFSDPNCPYCKQLEAELNKLNDVTIYTFIYAIKAQSIAPSKQVFCEADPALAWKNLIAKGTQPTLKKSCANPIERNIELGRSLGLQGTPVVIFSNGFKVNGAVPSTTIENMWRELGL